MSQKQELSSVVTGDQSKVVHVHIGMHKTASTYIQRRLRSNRDMLAKQGILYPDLRLDHLALVRAVAKRRKEPWLSWLDKAAGQNSQLLVSAEALSLQLAKAVDGEVGGLWLHDLLTAAGWELRVLVFVRDQPSYLNSRYTQLVKKLHTLSSFSSYVRMVAQGDSESECDMLRLFGWILAHPTLQAVFLPFRERALGSTPLSTASDDPYNHLLACLPLNFEPPSESLLAATANLKSDNSVFNNHLFIGTRLRGRFAKLLVIVNKIISRLPAQCGFGFLGMSTTAINQQPGESGVRLALLLGRYLRRYHPEQFSRRACRSVARQRIECLAARYHWHRTPFNGITQPLLEEIRVTYAYSNAQFAKAVWGSAQKWENMFASKQPQPQTHHTSAQPVRLRQFTIWLLRRLPRPIHL